MNAETEIRPVDAKPAKVRRSKEEIELDRAEAALIRLQKHNAAIDRLVAASKAHHAASEAARAAPMDQKALAAWSETLIEVEAASLALARYCIEKEA